MESSESPQAEPTPSASPTPNNDNNPDSTIPVDAYISQAAALHYWSNTTPTLSSMLGGYPQVSLVDLRSSTVFISKLLRSLSLSNSITKVARAVDYGAGIGRITSGLLVNFARVIDIVEPVRAFTTEFEKAEETKTLREEGRIGLVYHEGLESWTPTQKYDIVWNQWCLCHLSDVQLVDYIKRCLPLLEKKGWCIVKENVTKEEEPDDVYDALDSTVTRSEAKWLECFAKAGAEIVAVETQKGFPRILYPVKMWALQAKS